MQDRELRIETLTEFAQFDECVRMQDAVWGYEPADAMSQKVFLLASHIGGQVLGALQGDTLVGYAMSLPGVRNGKPYLHSHHLAVLPEFRNQGVGRRLKLAQRDEAIARGIELMEWTFDPLEIRNAHLNIAKLGAISRRYYPDFYGRSSSPLQGGLPSDRLVAEWWLRSEHVDRVLKGEQPDIKVEAEVRVPNSIYEWKASAQYRSAARELQVSNGVALQAGFKRGLSVVGYRRTEQGDGVYLLGFASGVPDAV